MEKYFSYTNDCDESDKNKLKVEFGLSLDLYRMAEARLGAETKRYIERLVENEIKRALKLQTPRDLYILNFEKVFEEKFKTISKEIVSFRMGDITFNYKCWALPYSPILVIDVFIGNTLIYIKFKSKSGSQRFRSSLSIASDNLNNTYGFKKTYEAVLNKELQITGNDTDIEEDVKKLYTLITDSIQQIHDELSNIYEKQPIKLNFQQD